MLIWIINVLKFKQWGSTERHSIFVLFYVVRKTGLLDVRPQFKPIKQMLSLCIEREVPPLPTTAFRLLPIWYGKMTQIQLFTPLIEDRLLFVVEAFLPYVVGT